jgi:hypothetical protein
MKANQNTTSTIAEKDAGLAQGTLLHPAKPSGDGSFVRDSSRSLHFCEGLLSA